VFQTAELVMHPQTALDMQRIISSICSTTEKIFINKGSLFHGLMIRLLDCCIYLVVRTPSQVLLDLQKDGIVSRGEVESKNKIKRDKSS